MFGLPVYRHFIQGSAIRTWNCVTHIANSIWYKLYPAKPPIMPRSRRRYHSRSRSRSRSGSHDRDRDAKRRKIEGYDDSSESEAIDTSHHKTTDTRQANASCVTISEEMDTSQINTEALKDKEDEIQDKKDEMENLEVPNDKDDTSEKEKEINSAEAEPTKDCNTESADESVVLNTTEEEPVNVNTDSANESVSQESTADNSTLDDSSLERDTNKADTGKNIFAKASITPAKPLTPKQIQKRLEFEKKKMERQKERDERERQKNAEKEERERLKNLEKEEREKKKQQERDEKNQLRLKLKQEKDDQKNKERLEKQKELDQIQKEKDQKRKEKEDLEEQKRLKRQQELEEKNKEKQKMLEQKQKTSTMFVNFFTKKKSDPSLATVPEVKKVEEQQNYFKPFELKSDMRLAPSQRREMSEDERNSFQDELSLQQIENLYLHDLKSGKRKGKQGKTWPYDEDDIMVVDDIGETIAESHKSKMRAKFLKFDENERPAYYGTWRKRSLVINPRAPNRMDTKLLNYDVDSDDEWEAEGEGESLKGSDDEDEKEQEPDQDYEVDNEFFVPHCYLSDDEIDDEANAKLNPELHKAKLKLLKNEFDAEMKSQTRRLKTTIYGCVWINKDDKNMERDPMRRHMDLFSCISNELPIIIPKQTDVLSNKAKTNKSKACPLDEEHLIEFVKCIHGNVSKRKVICREFLTYLADVDDIAACKQSLASLGRQMVEMAQWSKCHEEGFMFNKFCWNVKEDVREKYGLNLTLPNKWKLNLKPKK